LDANATAPPLPEVVAEVAGGKTAKAPGMDRKMLEAAKGDAGR
jgi:hypothetical protein